MGALTIIKYILAIFFGSIMFMFLGNIVYQTRYENSMWDDMPANILAFGDQEYGIWILYGIITIIAIVVLAVYNEANRNRAVAN